MQNIFLDLDYYGTGPGTNYGKKVLAGYNAVRDIIGRNKTPEQILEALRDPNIEAKVRFALENAVR